MSDAPAELVHLEVAGPVATITLDSPHNRNALSRQLVGELFDRLERAAGNDDVRVVLLRSADRVFCSGADLSEAVGGSMVEGAQRILALQRLLLTSRTAVVVRLAGPVRAGGIGIVAAADVVVASEEASFALTEVKLGLAPAVISQTVFGRMAPRAAALAALGGETFGGAEAAAWGLVTEVVAADRLDQRVDEVVASLATGAAQGLRETKALLNRPLVAALDDRGDDLAELSARLFGSEEARSAMAAFLARPQGA
ncbi:enoyl-CoA hydratase-related protein [Nocardioides sp. SYSU D00038]|uniref:enoyl-CoA hydratase-related protein n=1 Tax=Nocardioides sp. SYSU D00038 TaxID=2812554 RepID=UPI001F0773AB|nr:enoyl-CoA hydratase-related protein [Nocardioides sp. SYSU D00038]